MVVLAPVTTKTQGVELDYPGPSILLYRWDERQERRKAGGGNLFLDKVLEPCRAGLGQTRGLLRPNALSLELGPATEERRLHTELRRGTSTPVTNVIH